ncbi:MAG TPA: response regulator transcription factor [Pyrinomonadaceae bacterium]
MTEQNIIRVFSVDDHPLMHEGIATLINNQADMTLVAEASSGGEALERFHLWRPDVTLMDLRLPDMTGIEAMISIVREFPNARVIMLTMSEGDVEIRRALEAGARAYLLKTMPPKEITETIRRVYKGRKHIPAQIAAQLAEHLGEEDLTGREIEVLGLVGGGNRNRDIAERLFISEETVKVHVKHIMEKLNATDRTEAVSIAIRRGIIRL